MEMVIVEPRELNLCDGWEEQVNRRAERKAAKKRTNRILWTFCLALSLIVAGGIYLRQTGEIPLGISIVAEVSGVAVLSFTLGVLYGRRRR